MDGLERTGQRHPAGTPAGPAATWFKHRERLATRSTRDRLRYDMPMAGSTLHAVAVRSARLLLLSRWCYRPALAAEVLSEEDAHTLELLKPASRSALPGWLETHVRHGTEALTARKAGVSTCPCLLALCPCLVPSHPLLACQFEGSTPREQAFRRCPGFAVAAVARRLPQVHAGRPWLAPASAWPHACSPLTACPPMPACLPPHD